jgi:hypothetical protein
MSDEDDGDDEDDLFDYAESVRLRDEGMKRVAENNPTFSYQYFHYVRVPNQRKPGHARRQCLYVRVAPSGGPTEVAPEPTRPIPGQSGVAGSEPVAAFMETT